jgi:formate dehydrogenase
MANAGRLRDALARLELLVVTDIFLNETASLAHYVLPATVPFQRPDLPFIFPLVLGMQSRPYLQATEAVAEPEGEQRDEASIYLDLARASGAPIFGSRLAQGLLEGLRGLGRLTGAARPGALPQRWLLSALLRATGNGSFARLLAQPHGRALPQQRGGDFLGQRVVTDDGRVHLAPAVLLEQAARLEAAFEAERRADTRLKLITKRHVKTHNSWTHNDESYVAGRLAGNHLYMHPDDAAARGLAEGDVADVASRTATVRIPVKLLDDLQPGTVALPHGWGHQHAAGLSVASKTSGVNVNLLAADGPGELEPVSGMARLTGILVEVSRAAGERDVSSWSGISAG